MQAGEPLLLQHPTEHSGRATLGESKDRAAECSSMSFFSGLGASRNSMQAHTNQQSEPSHGFPENIFSEDVWKLSCSQPQTRPLVC